MTIETKDNYSISDLRDIVRVLRSENGCPWDREQTHSSIRKNFIEETYEACEAIDNNDSALLQEELGDVLLQIMLHSQMEEECGTFTFDEVVNDICKKLIIRHPHVFSNVQVSTVDDVLTNWNSIKQQTKGQTTVSETLHSVPKQLPSLMRAQKVQSRAAKGSKHLNYSSISQVLAELKGEISELEAAIENDSNVAEELGDVLFSAVNAARLLDLDAEELLTGSTNKFINRVEFLENSLLQNGKEIKNASAEELDKLWKEAKQS